MPFRRKLLFLLVLLVGVSCGLLLWLSLRKANQLAFELIQEKVYSIAVSTAPRIDGDKLTALVKPEQDGSPPYLEIRDLLREVRDANREGALPVRFIYLMRPLESGEWEYVVDAEEDGDDKSYLGDLVEFEHAHEKPPLDQARVDSDYARDSFGIWLSAFSPVLNASGEPVAVLGVDIAASRIQTLLRRLLFGDLLAMVVSLFLAAGLAAWLSGKVTRPLTELTQFVRNIGKGNFSSRIVLKSNDEFGELAAAVNQMAEGLEERESLKGALVDYVRSQAADSQLSPTLDHPENTETESRRVTVLVAELSGFSQLSSKLGSERVFALLNEYFSSMIDVVLRHRGSLEKSSDDKVIAVFGSNHEEPHQERHAIEASLAMQQVLAQLLKDWSVTTISPVQLIIGIHTGEAAVITSAGRDQIDYAAVREITRVATAISEVGREATQLLTVSEVTAENLHHTFPLTAIEDDTIDQAAFSVSMPQASLH